LDLATRPFLWILLLHIISVRPSKQPHMVRTFLKVYMEFGSYFLFLQEQIKDTIIMWALLVMIASEFGKFSHHLLSSTNLRRTSFSAATRKLDVRRRSSVISCTFLPLPRSNRNLR
jgi:hypothetical protein